NDPVPPFLDFAPQRLVDAAGANLTKGGHVFVTQPYASWFELAAEDMPVFLDSRIELFPPDLWDQYLSLQIVRDDWRDVIARWDMTVLVLEPDWRLAERLRQNPDWTLVYEDDDGT